VGCGFGDETSASAQGGTSKTLRAISGFQNLRTTTDPGPRNLRSIRTFSVRREDALTECFFRAAGALRTAVLQQVQRGFRAGSRCSRNPSGDCTVMVWIRCVFSLSPVRVSTARSLGETHFYPTRVCPHARSWGYRPRMRSMRGDAWVIGYPCPPAPVFDTEGSFHEGKLPTGA
jgi:hypothetical protein